MSFFFNVLPRRLRQLAGRYNSKSRTPAEALRSRYPEYEIGRGTYGDLTVKHWGEEAVLKIGNFCSIAQGVTVFLGGEHRPDWVTTYPFNILWPEARDFTGHPKTKGDVTIGSDVWIGTDALILSGVTIGNGAVIGARSVVSRPVPAYSIAVGNPATISRMRFPETIAERLEKVRWWDWPDDIILRAMPDLLSKDISIFLENAEAGQYAQIERQKS